MIVHYLGGIGNALNPACTMRGDWFDADKAHRMAKRGTTVKADVTCKLCIHTFRHSASIDQRATLTPAWDR